MPKRSNDFQKLIFHVNNHIADNAILTESKILKDRLTGDEREVDICIEFSQFGHNMVISIECIDKSRPADITWINTMKAKHEHLPTNYLVLISRAGFTRKAFLLAKKYGIETLIMKNIDENIINNTLKGLKSLWFSMWSFVPTKIKLNVVTDEKESIEVYAYPDFEIYNNDGENIGDLQSLINILLDDERLNEYCAKNATEEHKGFVFGCDSPKDDKGNPKIFIKKTDPIAFHGLCSVHIEGSFHCKVSEFPLQKASLDKVNVFWSKSKIIDKNGLLVMTEDSEGKRKISMTISNK